MFKVFPCPRAVEKVMLKNRIVAGEFPCEGAQEVKRKKNEKNAIIFTLSVGRAFFLLFSEFSETFKEYFECKCVLGFFQRLVPIRHSRMF